MSSSSSRSGSVLRETLRAASRSSTSTCSSADSSSGVGRILIRQARDDAAQRAESRARRARRSGRARTGCRRRGSAGRSPRAQRAIGDPAGASSVTGLTGPSESTQVSLLPPPRCIETIGTSCVLDDARQSAGHHDVGVARGRDVRPKHDRPRLQLLPVPDRRGRERDLLLRDEVVRPRAHLGREQRASRGSLSCRPNTGSRAVRRERRLDDQLVEVLEHVLQSLRVGRTTRWRPTAAAGPRRAGAGTAPAGTAGGRRSRSRPSRARWRSSTLPARAASTRPATPSDESLRSSSGSQKLSSSRRKMTSTGCRPSSVLMKTRRSRTVRSPPSTSVKPR